jgi:hypothetical protein
MLDVEIRDFVRATLGVQHATGLSMDQAKQYTASMLGIPLPSEADFNRALIETPAKKRRGRIRSAGLTKRDAVAALSVYFESVGARPEQAIDEAKRWLGITLSRRVAKVAVAAFRANTASDQYKVQALWAYATLKPGTTLPLPDHFLNVRKKRRPNLI